MSGGGSGHCPVRADPGIVTLLRESIWAVYHRQTPPDRPETLARHHLNQHDTFLGNNFHISSMYTVFIINTVHVVIIGGEV